MEEGKKEEEEEEEKRLRVTGRTGREFKKRRADVEMREKTDVE